ncbi:hypothetical protein QUA20_15440 [Microcoleus sp. Pol7_A1]|uniref:hypothetical protein n=1 Tax=Microcoleus sp. Pol7_A1 TaxID=2818893 RepID=UPI002FD21548
MSQTTLYLRDTISVGTRYLRGHDICEDTAVPCPYPPGTIAQISNPPPESPAALGRATIKN